ncbi:hypothetical protein BKA66DRAFT_79747 [Pyrenochaeta sp. MPI-SDFR-AT-0127]|nr:hypothetical protein BKA66DRAFT_79747 [Pyrenochaeta sp. MPI-SDFR-AT-0127]
MSSTLSVTSYIAAQPPVPTVFTPPAFCGNFVDRNDWFTKSELTLCVPKISLKPASYFSSVYYSPAICPAGYTVDCSRYETDQRPPVKTGETAVICCPNSFTCNLSLGNWGCISRTKSDAVTALSVQIRWQSSDLSLLQTPPLTTGLPKSNRHLGWLPESSLTFPYVIPTDCSSITDLFMPYGKESCEPLTGTYYSPAICPSGWTVETTMTADDIVGPPREADETVALCCPSGMSRLPDICGREACVSATITAEASSLSLDLLRVRDGVQIRWAPTDMAVLETHPLTPGLRIPRQTVTMKPLPSPRGLYKVGIGLAVLPVLLAAVAVALGAMSLGVRRHARLRRRPDYKPASFSVGTLVLLIAVAVASIILLELSCHIVLRDDAPDPFPRSLFESNSSSTPTTPSALAQRRVSMTAGTTTLPMGMSCWPTTYASSTSSAGRLLRLTTTRSTTRSTTPTTTIACASSGTPVAIPSCDRGSGAPPGQKWLAYRQHGEGGLVKVGGSPDAAYFFANMLPTLLASLFSIPWKMMQVDAALLEPFRQLALGAPAKKSILGNYQTFHALRAPLPLVTSCLALASAAVTALSAEGWGLRVVGSCDKRISMDGCVPEMQVTPWVVRAIMAILAILSLLAALLAVLSRSCKLGVYADPRSILGVATLAHSPSISSIFANVDPTARLKTLKARIGHIPLHLGTDTTTREYGIQRSEQALLQHEKAGKPEPSYLGDATQLGRMPVAKLAFLFACFTVFLMALTTLTIYYIVTSADTGFERFMSGQGFGPRFIFAICGVVVNFGWVYIFQVILRLLPYYAMQPLAPASKSILQSYSSDHFSAFASGIRSRNLSLVLLALPVIMSEFLPLLLATVPYSETTTWRAHLVSSWTAVAVLGLMIVIMLVVIVLLVAGRPNHYLNVELLTKTPLAATLLLVSGSSDFLSMWRGFAPLERKERDTNVQERGLMYGLVAVSAEKGSAYPRIQVAHGGG